MSKIDPPQEAAIEEPYLYRQIANSVRQRILQGALKPGDRLLPVRDMAVQWNCTVGTIQRAYLELAGQGLVTSRAGQGTRVVENLPMIDESPMRRAALIHRAEAFLLEVLTAGYSPSDVEDAVRQALDRWRTVQEQAAAPSAQLVRFAGSHDLAVSWLASRFGEIAPGFGLQLAFSGSLGGLIALAEGRADLAGCHLWDEETDSYNAPFVRRLLPGRRVALITLAHRQVGLIVGARNLEGLGGLEDLKRPGLRFVNRQAGSGTRVWLDSQLRRIGLQPGAIQGYTDERMTHSEVAAAVAEGGADAGLGLEASARMYGLDFIPLTRERYDLVVPAPGLEMPALQALTRWLEAETSRQEIARLDGYDFGEMGNLRWVE